MDLQLLFFPIYLFNSIALTWGQGGTWLLESFGSGSLEAHPADRNKVFFSAPPVETGAILPSAFCTFFTCS